MRVSIIMGRFAFALVLCAGAARADSSVPGGDATVAPTLWAVAGSGPIAWAVGERGVIVRLSRLGRQPLHSPTTRTLRALFVDQSGGVAVGDGGAVVRWERYEAAAGLATPPADEDLIDVVDTGHALYVASRRALYRSLDRGGTWTRVMAAPATRDITRFAVRADGTIAVEALARANREVALGEEVKDAWRWWPGRQLDRAEWRPFNGGSYHVDAEAGVPTVFAHARCDDIAFRVDGRALHGLWSRNDSEAWLIGDRGAVFHTTAGSHAWEPVP